MDKARIKQMRAPTEEEQALKARVREEMTRDRCRLLDRQPFVGKLAMHLELIPVIDHRLTTACTDGTHLFVDAEFFSRLDSEERLGILAHETWHNALRHGFRLGNRDRDRFNYACDVEVDLLLHQDGFKIKMLPFSPDWIEMTAEQIYELMSQGLERFQKDDKHIYPGDRLDEQDKQQGRNNQPRPRENTGKDSRNDSPSDTSSNPAEKGNVEGTGNGGEAGGNGGEVGGNGGEAGGNGGEAGGNGGEAGGNGGEAGGNGGEVGGNGGEAGGNGTCLRPGLPQVSHNDVIDPDFRPSCSDEVEENWKNNLKTAVQQLRRSRGRYGKGRGFLPGNVAGLVSDDELDATVDWKRVLLDYVTQVFGGEQQWLPPSRRYVWKKLYLPGRAKKKSIEIVLAIDTSGSTTSDLPDFLAELRGMVNAFGEYKLTIIQCDARIHSVKEYSNDDPLPEDSLMFYGFGGTSFLPPFQYVEEKMEEPPTVFIYLTDGYGDAPQTEPDYPVIWCITQTGKKPTTWGLEVQINSSMNKDRT
jgi:predicted metal-dependent peptidase